MPSPEIGPHREDRWRGLLAFGWLSDELQRAEDARAVADFDRGQQNFGDTFKRPATPTERILLAHLGFSDLPDDLVVVVGFWSGGLRKRWFYSGGRELTL